MKNFISIASVIILLISILCINCKEEQSSESENDLMPIDSLFESFYQESLILDPMLATYFGDNRYNDTLTNYISQNYIDSLLAFYSGYEELIKEYDLKDLNDKQKVSMKLMRWLCMIKKEGLMSENVLLPSLVTANPQFQLLPINQALSFHLDFCGWAGGEGIHPFKTVKDYTDWLSRVEDFSAYIDTVISNFKKGMEKNIVYPKVITQKLIEQLENLSDTSVEDHVFCKPVKQFPESFSEEEKEKLTVAYTKIVRDLVIPKFKELSAFMEETYLPACRESVGLSELPGGKEAYAYLIKYWTTSDMTADEIFETGKKEVERISEEMFKVKEQVGYEGDLIEFLNYVRTKKELMPFTETSEIINHFKDIHKTIEPNLNKLFLREPKASFEIQIYDSFLGDASPPQYVDAAIDGSRPGILYIPVSDPKKYHILSDESLFAHEVIPGHYFQGSLQIESTEFPMFRKTIWCGAYGEGWALYAESLGKELGLYTDPYQYLGTLNEEMHRAIRLVVDVGIHAKGWTREQAVQYSLEHEAGTKASIIAEIDRYISIPGQALSYKIGQLKIMELRSYAEKELGDQFDIKAFHDEILSLGSVPLQILEEEIHDWVNSFKK